jgi:hypothetical protein
MIERSFTIDEYKEILQLFINKNYETITFKDYIRNKNNYTKDNILLIRHDVDRKIKNSFEMAKVENEMGLIASYYFRDRTFDEVVIKEILKMNHEVGYHYETLSDTNGDFKGAYELFILNLKKFNKLTNVETICMHGRPFSKHDNRDLWKNLEYKNKLENLNISELYLDIDYKEILYINDTGRNWLTNKDNKRDHVFSNLNADFESVISLKEYLKDNPNNLIVFQIHPERWSISNIDWIHQYLMDFTVNNIKRLLK